MEYRIQTLMLGIGQWWDVNHPPSPDRQSTIELARSWGDADEDDVWPTGEHARYRVVSDSGEILAEFPETD